MSEDNRKEENTQEQETSSLRSARSYVMILLIAVLCFYAMLSNTKSTGQALPMIFGKGCAIVMTGSMEPTLPVDSLIFVSEKDDYKEGDIVVIQDYYTLVVHRIVSIDENEVITKGDANNTEDEPSLPSAIRGKVIGHIPYVGAGIRLMKTPLGSMCFIGIILIFWVLSNRGDDEEKSEE